MVVEGLKIPDLMQSLLDAARWPRNSAEVFNQNVRPLVSQDRNRRFRKVCLYSPPFHTVAQAMAGGESGFYARHGALHELIPDAAIEIADFGIGADSPILLDYSVNRTEPRVIHLEWLGDGNPNHWVVMAPDFTGFVEILGL